MLEQETKAFAKSVADDLMYMGALPMSKYTTAIETIREALISKGLGE